MLANYVTNTNDDNNDMQVASDHGSNTQWQMCMLHGTATWRANKDLHDGTSMRMIR